MRKKAQEPVFKPNFAYEPETDISQSVRFKLNHKGWEVLTDAEVLSFMFGSNTQALDTARRLLNACHNSLAELARMPFPEMQEIEGIGENRALAISAAMEIARRKNEADLAFKIVIKSSEDVFNLMKPDLIDLLTEEFWVVLLNRSNRVLKKVFISAGGVSGTMADPKVIFKSALENLAASVILVHNHPSGNLTPSAADIALTKKLTQGGEFLETPVLDHIIIGGNNFYSFADEGKL